MKRGNIHQILEDISHLDIDNQWHIEEVLSKRLCELRRENIAKRAKEAEKSYKEGRVKMGGFEDLWKNLND